MLKSLKGKFVAASCRSFDKLPGAAIQERLGKQGWGFSTIDGCAGEEPVYVIMHPDGKPVDGYGSPGYMYDRDGDNYTKEGKALIKLRWKDFANACANRAAPFLGFVQDPPRETPPVRPAAALPEPQAEVAHQNTRAEPGTLLLRL